MISSITGCLIGRDTYSHEVWPNEFIPLNTWPDPSQVSMSVMWAKPPTCGTWPWTKSSRLLPNHYHSLVRLCLFSISRKTKSIIWQSNHGEENSLFKCGASELLQSHSGHFEAKLPSIEYDLLVLILYRWFCGDWYGIKTFVFKTFGIRTRRCWHTRGHEDISQVCSSQQGRGWFDGSSRRKVKTL